MTQAIAERRARQGRDQMGRMAPGTWWVVIRFGEIALKKGNRPYFFRVVRENIDRALTGLPVSGARVRPNRGFVRVYDPEAWPAISERLATVFGIQGYSLAKAAPREMDAFEAGFFQLVDGTPETFGIRASRGDKSFHMTSNQIERELGARVQARIDAQVDLDNPDVRFHVEIQPESAFLYVSRDTGRGGLPVGTAGRVVVLLSGGIDSPVAAHQMIKRGCTAEFVHFSSFPFTDSSSQEKARELVNLLTPYQFESRLHIVPFGQVQQRLIVSAPAKYRILLYRRMMLRIAERMGQQLECDALVTGESLGQVGSQTMTNIATVDNAVEAAVLRPLVGYDKREIMSVARRIGTYETSIQPDMDCCQYLVPDKVKTHSTPEELDEIQADLPIDELIDMALQDVTVEEFRWPK
ncbi:MAG: tRNA uracil 4-sulfurtransferase ThiI [Dehalococcoidia bacterium]|nr:tRNA uracil 4-sulfurtransferase ThiI [Dehalococcoidia bacterium]